MENESVVFRSSDLPEFMKGIERETRKAHMTYAGVVSVGAIYSLAVYLALPLTLDGKLLTILASLPLLVLVAGSTFLSLRDLRRFPVVVASEGIRSGRLLIPVRSARTATYVKGRDIVELDFVSRSGKARKVRFLSTELGDPKRFLEALSKVGIPTAERSR